MISKKLWGLVTGYPEPSHLKLFGTKDVTAVVGDDMISINIYELAYKCRLWALSQGYSIETRPYHEYDKVDWQIVAWEVKTEKQNLFDLHVEEHEAIFVVCEWVRKELLK